MRRGRIATLLLLGLCGAAWAVWPSPAPEILDLPFTAALPEGRPLHMLALGTSLTARAQWPDQIAAELAACIGTPVTVARAAEAGANSAMGLKMLARVLPQMPDLVFVEFAVNDADILDGLSLAASSDMHRTLIQTLRAARPDAAIVLITTNPTRGLRGLTRPRLARFYASYREIARTEGTGLFDAYPRWLSHGTGAIDDGLHPAPEAEAELLSPPLVAMIAQGYGFDC